VAWQIYDGRLDWFYLDEGAYKERAADELETLQQGLAMAENE